MRDTIYSVEFPFTYQNRMSPVTLDYIYISYMLSYTIDIYILATKPIRRLLRKIFRMNRDHFNDSSISNTLSI